MPAFVSGVKRKRIRAHRNPLADFSGDYPRTPAEFPNNEHYPAMFTQEYLDTYFKKNADKSNADDENVVRIADVGCGFGGLLVGLAPLFPNKQILGLEIRPKVVDIVENRILKLREAYKDATAYDAYTPTEVTPNPPSIPDIKLQVSPYNNISVTICNFMRHAPNYFRKGQLEKMFILFADPHFKQQNHRRRIINANFLSLYAYILKEGGMLYMITDVKDLFDWNLKYLEAHPLFERIPDSELVDDPCMYVMANETEEGKKVTRINGDKYPAVFRRIKGE